MAETLPPAARPLNQQDDHNAANANQRSVDMKEVQVASRDDEKELGAPAIADATPQANIVDWDGDDDPAYPMNWTNARKFKNVSVICYCTFLTYVTTMPMFLLQC